MKKRFKQLLNAALPRSVAVDLWSGRQYRQFCRRYPLGMEQSHRLGGRLVVSLTSFPPRYPTLHLTLRSLLRQNTRSDGVVLWIAEGDEAALPRAVRRMLSGALQLRIVDDVRSYKKLVFALQEFPDAYIATADDDVFYEPAWLTELVQGQAGVKDVITCHRAHRLKMAPNGGLAQYRDWAWDVQDQEARQPSVNLMPTGIGGILYPPHSLHRQVTERVLFERYAPSADDLWFYWCARRAGSVYKKVGPRFAQMTWNSSQQTRLFDDNAEQNDTQISALVNRFGNPLLMPSDGSPAMEAG